MRIIDIVHVHQLKKKQDLIWHQRHHKHEKNQYEFHYFLEGEGSLLIEKKHIPFNKHELYIVLPEVMHAVQSKNRYLAPISYYAILFEIEPHDKVIKSFLENVDFIAQFPFMVSLNNRLIFKVLLEQYMQEENEFFKKSAEYKLYSYLYELFATKNHPTDQHMLLQAKRNNSHIKRCINYMYSSIYEKISIETIALHVGISPEYLIRLFKKHLNTTPYSYFTQLKIEKCCGLHTNTNMKVHEIAEKFQFSNAQNFTRLFTKQTGISPSIFRNTYLHSTGIYYFNPPTTH